mgnify:CR=1 FL=1
MSVKSVIKKGYNHFLFLIIIHNIIPYTSTLNFFEFKYFFLALLFSLVAQVGNLTISCFKRKEKIKDTGKILPGHGGIFDRIGGLMFVVIVTIIFYKFNIIP